MDKGTEGTCECCGGHMPQLRPRWGGCNNLCADCTVKAIHSRPVRIEHWKSWDGIEHAPYFTKMPDIGKSGCTVCGIRSLGRLEDLVYQERGMRSAILVWQGCLRCLATVSQIHAMFVRGYPYSEGGKELPQQPLSFVYDPNKYVNIQHPLGVSNDATFSYQSAGYKIRRMPAFDAMEAVKQPYTVSFDMPIDSDQSRVPDKGTM